MRTDITPWARATMTPEDWQTLRDAEPKEAKVSAIVNHRTRRLTLSVVHHKTLTHTGYGATVREAWDARQEVEAAPVNVKCAECGSYFPDYHGGATTCGICAPQIVGFLTGPAA